MAPDLSHPQVSICQQQIPFDKFAFNASNFLWNLFSVSVCSFRFFSICFLIWCRLVTLEGVPGLLPLKCCFQYKFKVILISFNIVITKEACMVIVTQHFDTTQYLKFVCHQHNRRIGSFCMAVVWWWNTNKSAVHKWPDMQDILAAQWSRPLFHVSLCLHANWIIRLSRSN